MKKEFDFDDVGKQTPYRTPDRFFEEVQRKVMESTGCKRHQKNRIVRTVSISLAIAAVLMGLLFLPLSTQTEYPVPASTVLAIEANDDYTDLMDKWIGELSDEELEEFINFSENDIFLN